MSDPRLIRPGMPGGPAPLMEQRAVGIPGGTVGMGAGLDRHSLIPGGAGGSQAADGQPDLAALLNLLQSTSALTTGGVGPMGPGGTRPAAIQVTLLLSRSLIKSV